VSVIFFPKNTVIPTHLKPASNKELAQPARKQNQEYSHKYHISLQLAVNLAQHQLCL
jgi:hypothetical protein